jgi:DNA-binding NtrC family response regulator
MVVLSSTRIPERLPLSETIVAADFKPTTLSPRTPRNGHENHHLLIVDDDESMRWLLQKKFEHLGFLVDVAGSREHAIKYFSQKSYAAIILDNCLDDGYGVDLIPQIVSVCPMTKIVVLTAYGTIDMAVKAMHAGASALCVKSESIEQNLNQIIALLFPGNPEETFAEVDCSRYGIIGRSEPLQSLVSRICRIAPTDATVLLTGESGTGKELFARAIHQLSLRRHNPFLAINCAAIASTLMEVELFGCRRGAFTDAKSDRKGFFEVCSNGTLMLDEIGEMPLELQAKLLRVLQEHEVTPVGSCSTVQVNTRVIAVTNAHIEELVRQGKFRKDLYYRLAVVTLKTPALREIKDDIGDLVRFFFQKYNRQFGKKVHLPSPGVIAKLKRYDWPGNIRELQNAVERSVLFASHDEVSLQDLLSLNSPQALAPNPALATLATEEEGGEKEVRGNSPQRDGPVLGEGMPLHYLEAKRYFEKQYLGYLLRETNGVISEAAEVSGQYRPNLYRMIKKYQMDLSEYKESES